MKITKRQLRRIIREAMIDEPIRQVPGDSFPANTLKSRRSHKPQGSSEFRDTIVMSPTGDSILVGGYETDPSMIDITLKEITGHEVPAGMYTALEKEINKQMSSGYVEIPISWSSDTGWRF